MTPELELVLKVYAVWGVAIGLGLLARHWAVRSLARQRGRKG